MLASFVAAAFMAPAAPVLQEPDLLGLSAREVVALGYDAWSSKYVTKFGESTGVISSGNESFAYALRMVNDEAARSKPGMPEVMARLRPQFTRAADAAIQAQATASGGGSYWAVVDSYTEVQREMALKQVLEIDPEGPGLDPDTWDVWTEVGRVRQALNTAQELSAGEREMAGAALNFFSSEFYLAQYEMRDMPYPIQSVAIKFYLDVISALKRMAE